MKKWIKHFFKWGFLLILALIVLIIGSYYGIKNSTQSQLYNDIENVPYRKVAVVLGTSKRVSSGHPNLFFKYRMEAVANLYQAGKIKYIIVSGDNSIVEYNETRDMKNALVDLGIPEGFIVEDYAGFRTLDSVVRAKEVFGQDSITIVSQQFHNERALFIANHHGMSAVGFNAQDVPSKYSVKTKLREYLARVKAVLDIYVLQTMPKFYKEKEDFPK